MVRAISLFGIAMLTAAAAGAASPGRVVVVQGTAEVTRSSDTKELFAGDLIEEGDIVEAGDDSYIRMVMADGSILDLGANARLVIRKYTGKHPARKVTLKLWVGRLWARVIESVGGEDDYVLSGANAVVGIRGTEIVLDVHTDGSAEVVLIHGRASLNSLIGDTAGLELSAMERGVVDTAGNITKGALTQTDVDNLRKQGKPAPKLDKRGAKKRLDAVRERLQLEVTPTPEPMEVAPEQLEDDSLDDLDRLDDDPVDPLLDLDPDAIGGLEQTTHVRGDVEVLP